MNYIVVATKHEAKPLNDIFKLSFSNDTKGFKLYQNNDIKLIISGIGKINCAIASTYLLCNSNQKDMVFNIGICAGKNIGEFCEFGKVVDKESKKEIILDDSKKTLFSSNSPSFDQKLLYCDMESSGFVNCALKFLPKENIKIFKIVSDTFEPQIFTKKYIYDLIFAHQKKLKEKIYIGS